MHYQHRRLIRQHKRGENMNAKKAWTDLQGYVKAGPATGVEGTGNEDAKKPKKVQTNTKRDWDTTNDPKDGPSYGTNHDDSNVHGKGNK